MDWIQITNVSVDVVKENVREWIKLYPHSFDPDVNFKFYQMSERQIVIELHDDISTLAVSLLVVYLTSAGDETKPEVEAFLTVDDNEILLKQNLGKRAKIFVDNSGSNFTGVKILLDNNYCFNYHFEGKAKPVKDHAFVFDEPDIELPEKKDEIMVGDVISPKKKIELKPEKLTPKKLMWYLICGIVGTAIGFLIVYLTSK